MRKSTPAIFPCKHQHVMPKSAINSFFFFWFCTSTLDLILLRMTLPSECQAEIYPITLPSKLTHSHSLMLSRHTFQNIQKMLYLWAVSLCISLDKVGVTRSNTGDLTLYSWSEQSWTVWNQVASFLTHHLHMKSGSIKKRKEKKKRETKSFFSLLLLKQQQIK